MSLSQPSRGQGHPWQALDPDVPVLVSNKVLDAVQFCDACWYGGHRFFV